MQTCVPPNVRLLKLQPVPSVGVSWYPGYLCWSYKQTGLTNVILGRELLTRRGLSVKPALTLPSYPTSWTWLTILSTAPVKGSRIPPPVYAPLTQRLFRAEGNWDTADNKKSSLPSPSAKEQDINLQRYLLPSHQRQHLINLETTLRPLSSQRLHQSNLYNKFISS